MPYFALTPELTSNYDERTTLTTYRMAFSIIGAMIAYVGPLAIIGTMSPDRAGTIFNVGAGVALLSIIPMVVVFIGTRERPELQEQKQPTLKGSLLAAFRNRPFINVMGIFLLTWAALDIVQTTLLYFLKHRMHLAEQGDLIFGLLFVAALISLPIWEWSARRWDKQKAYIGGMIFFAISVVGLCFLKPEWGLTPVLVLGAMAGIGLGAIQVLTWAMIPDTVEWDELQTGQRHEGMYYSLVTLFRKIAASLTLPLVLLVLDRTGYVANADVQPKSAITGIQALIGPIPSVLVIAGIIITGIYPLTRARHAQVRAELAERKK
jgi:glycoside/pentoside/hexuronide:cation symporter, GPH family